MSLRDRFNNGISTVKQKETIKPKEDIFANNAGAPNGINILEALLADKNINSIYINGAKNVYIERKGKILKSTVTFRDNIQLTNLILRLAEDSGIEETNITPYMNFAPKSGMKVKAILPPVNSLPFLCIKCYHDKLATIKNFQDTGVISKELALIFEALATIKYNIIIAGEENTLKTSVLSALTKSIPINNRGYIFDDFNEVNTNSQSFSSLNLSTLKESEKEEIISSIINSGSDKIILNDKNESILKYFINRIEKINGSLLTTIEASSKEEALERIIKLLMEINPACGYEEAKKSVYNTFNLIIFCSKDDEGKRKISSISEIEKNEENNCIIRDIFVINKTENQEEHNSTGIIPKLYELAKNESLPINPNIFVNDYKHTYSVVPQNEGLSKNIKNIEVLKKFKKELNRQFDANTTASGDEFIKKAQEKFEALKRNAKNQDNESISEAYEFLHDGTTIQDINNSLKDSENIADEQY